MKKNIKRISIMKRAHEIRKEQQLEGNYNVQMKIALKLAWAESAKKEAINANTTQKKENKQMELYNKTTMVLRKIVKKGKLRPAIYKGEQYKFFIYHKNNLSINFHVYKNNPSRNILVGYVNGDNWVWNISKYMYPCVRGKQNKEFRDTILIILINLYNQYNDEVAITKENSSRVSNNTLDKIRTSYINNFKDIELDGKIYYGCKFGTFMYVIKEDDIFVVYHCKDNDMKKLIAFKDILIAIEVAKQLSYKHRKIGHKFSMLLPDDIKLINNITKKAIMIAKNKGANVAYA